MLGQALKCLPPPTDPRLLVGIETSDDAGVFQLTPELALVQTVDFFTPIVDDPYWFGRIAAANALSDVYAMGGTPITALNIVGFPDQSLPLEILGEILRGGADAAREAGVSLLGGHSVRDPELKYGMSVTGTIHPARIVTNTGAQPGDILVLTKALGTGIVTTALKRGALDDEALAPVIESMATLNRLAAQAMLALDVHGATDITGFGLLGHGLELARGSQVTLELWADALPLFERTLTLAAEGFVPGGSRNNLTHVSPHVHFDDAVSEALRWVMVDPQTSGGLLMSLPAHAVTRLATVMETVGVPLFAVIGRVTAVQSIDDHPLWIEVRAHR